MTSTVLFSFGSDARDAGEHMVRAIASEGWQCRVSSDIRAHPPRNDLLALVLLISQGSIHDPQILQDVDRATDRNLPIVPCRVDATPISKTLEYYIGTIGTLDACQVGLSEATRQIHRALERLSRAQGRPGSAWEELQSFGRPPAFRLQPVFRTCLMAGLGVSLLLGLGGVVADAAFLSGITPRLSPVIALANLSGLIAGFAAWFATIWFYRAHRNLVILGETRSRFRSTALIWRLVVPGVNFVASAPVIREILTKPDGQGAFTHLVWVWAWSWPLLNLGQWVHSTITNLHLQVAHARLLAELELAINVVQTASATLVMLILHRVTQRQAELRERLATAAPSSAQSAGESSRPVMISWAEHDRRTAEVICSALDSAVTPCRLAPRDDTWRIEMVDQFSAVVLVVSSSLGESLQSLQECLYADRRGLTIIPFRVDHSPLPAQFDFIRPRHWIEAEEAAFVKNIAAVRALVSGTAARSAPVPEDRSEARTGASEASHNRLLQIAMYGSCGILAAVAGTESVFDLLAMGMSTGPMSFSHAFSRSYFWSAATVRSCSGLAVLLTYISWRPGSAARASWPRWSLQLLALLMTGLGAPFAWNAGHAVLAGSWRWAASAGVAAAAFWDLAVNSLILAVIRHGFLEAFAADARLRAQNWDSTRARRLRIPRLFDPLRFRRQDRLETWIGYLGAGSVIVFVLFGLGDIDPEGDARTQFITTWVFQLMLCSSSVAILFLVWVHAAFRNVMAMGNSRGLFSTGAGVLCLATPFVNIPLAVPILEDLLVSSAQLQPREVSGKRLIRTFWGCLLAYWAITWLRFGLTIPANKASIVASDIVMAGLWAGVCMLSKSVAAKIGRQQFDTWRGRSGSA